MTQNLIKWLSDNLISYEDLGIGRFQTDLGICFEVESSDKILDLNKAPTLILNDLARQLVLEERVEYLVFQFGSRFYYTSVDEIELKNLNQFRYIGEVNWGTPINKECRAHLMVHGKYELMCGLHDYKQWAKKAKFLGYTALGLCEKNTLAGAIQFTQACKENDLKPIIGIQTSIIHLNDVVEVKLYATSQKGWENIMYVNSQNKELTIDILIKHLQDVICIISPSGNVNEQFIYNISEFAHSTFYQLTTVTYQYQNKQKEVLENMKWFIRKYRGFTSVKCILQNDTYCLEKDQQHLKEVLIKQSNNKVFLTDNHYFKSYDGIVKDFYNLFEKEDIELFRELIFESKDSMKAIIDSVNFTVDSTELKLPTYQMIPEEEVMFTSNEDLFKTLIQSGLDKIDFSKYSKEVIFERISREGKLIKEGGFIDYFLILWDIIRFCAANSIEVGPGRGSAAGSLISYLLGITKLNPLDYDLLFERFLNESRIKSELPDIDIDFASDRRDEVLKYLRDRYGFDFVCQVGTYGTLKLKSSLKELNRYYKEISQEEINYLSKLFGDEQDSYFDIFKTISQTSNKRLIEFVRNNYSLLHDVESLIGSLKSNSIHACATIIVPRNPFQNDDDFFIEKPVYKQIPIRVHEDGTLVSEWEGEELAKAGYLKEDILSTKQMAKIGNMIQLVKKHYNEDIRTEEIPLDDSRVYDLFCQGYNQDVFHFGSSGLTSYLRHLQPRTIEDLIAAIALYRPGAMSSDSHMEFVKLKNGEKTPQYDFMMEEVTKNTYGLYIYQEQIMKAVQVLGGFTLTEADGVRKAMGKKIKEKMDSYGQQFKQNAVNKGCSPEEADNIWNKLQVFSSYGFNKSHAAAYSVIGYICNWFKVNYPMEFWITAFEYADEDHLPEYLSEISKISDIKVSPPDINRSTDHFQYDINERTLYWDLTKIKQVAEKAVQAILIERAENGQFYSIDDFFYRMENLDLEKHGFAVMPINKRVMEHLILAGTFDNLHALDESFSRFNLMYRYYKMRKEDIPRQFVVNSKSRHYWPIQQYMVCKLSTLDYKSLVYSCEEFISFTDRYFTGEEFNYANKPQEALVIGVLEEFLIRQTKKGQSYATLKLSHNTEIINIRIWPDELSSEDTRLRFKLDDQILTIESALPLYQNKIVIIRGNLQLPDEYKNYNELVVSSHLQGELIKFFD